MGALTFWHGDWLAALFARDPAVVAAARQYLQAYAIDCLLTPLLFCFTGYFNGCEKTLFVMAQGIIGAFCVRIPVAWAMSRLPETSLFLIGLGTPASSLVQDLLCVGYFLLLMRKGWREAGYLDKYPERSVGIITPFARQRECIEDLLKVRGYANASCGTVHAFQGDEKDVVIFSLAVTDRTRPETYKWLKDNKELINVATSRAREQLVVLSNQAQLDRLHAGQAGSDDLYELVQYVKSHGTSRVTAKPAASRALGIKPYSTKTEDAFLENLNHALDNAFLDGRRCTVRREVAISQVFVDNPSCVDLFYTGRFDFVVYERQGGRLMPILAIELDGKEHRGDPAVQARDRKKEAICREHGFELIRVENSYARRYHYIKEILIRYFGGR